VNVVERVSGGQKVVVKVRTSVVESVVQREV